MLRTRMIFVFLLAIVDLKIERYFGYHSTQVEFVLLSVWTT